MALVGKFLIAVGTALLLHAGYYSVQCASLLFIALRLVHFSSLHASANLTYVPSFSSTRQMSRT